MGSIRAFKRSGVVKEGYNAKTSTKALQKGFMTSMESELKRMFQAGLEKGLEDGFFKGWETACDHFLEVLYYLDDAKGIGPKHYQTIINRFGYQDKEEFKKENRWTAEE